MKTVNGTSYKDTTDDEVIRILETCRISKKRIRLFYGLQGESWNDENDTIGYVGRSMGKNKIPLLIKSSRSMGGGAILDDCIYRIDTKDGKGKIVTVYQSDDIKADNFIATDIGTVYNETTDTLYARCKNADSGKRLADFMNGKRWSK
jgi:hypothetical protein